MPRCEPAGVAALGETMALIVPGGNASIVDADAFTMATAGAESNVACAVAQLGVPARWVSRVGSDPLGARVVREISSHGVDTSRVRADPQRRTGVMFKEPESDSSAVYYYRTASAASAMSVDDLPTMFDGIAVQTVVHLSGVTPALSASCAELIHALLIERQLGDEYPVAFDVNYRASLWEPGTAPSTLARLAAASNICFVGLDEAMTLWDTRTPEDVRDLLPDVAQLVVKDGGRGVTIFLGDGSVHWVDAIPVDVVEPVGAGDAFAGGYLAATIGGAHPRIAARVGHLTAANVLRVRADVAPQPPLDGQLDIAAAMERQSSRPRMAKGSKL